MTWWTIGEEGDMVEHEGGWTKGERVTLTCLVCSH